ncbi:DUF5689 domain-containing protein [uncultured Psychroserpens sp.]|uniref:DUF5689 domain-containing protein n=1 Tax=uncultured Psychroserpens sp. TaxID=255436 RepID=UPI00262A026C|nr:DUF5689 domain-containing protein [uncultured Psychroserpens sp.]
MKTINLNKILLLSLIMVVFSACVQDDDFDTPSSQLTTPSIDQDDIVSIDDVIGNFLQSGENSITIEDTNTFMEGYVISSDEGGNFFEELVLQDRPENPTAGIVVQIDVNPLFTIYDFGRKVYVKLDGLTVAVDNGVIQIGKQDGEDLAKISASQMSERIIRTPEVATIVPLEISTNDFSDAVENLYIRLNNVQFGPEEVLGDTPLSFASEPDDEFDGERTLVSCETGGSVVFSTSTFADFKSLRLPVNNGTVDGVLSRDFFDEFYTLSVNSPEDINFDNGNRCGCGLAETMGMTNLFEDDFETQSTNSLISGNGWTNYIEAGTEGWEAYSSGGANASLGISARVGSFGSDDVSTIAWLITPAIDLDAQTGETFKFRTSNSFADNATMNVLFSTDWDGTEANITTATWTAVVDARVTTAEDDFPLWIDSGIVDLDCFSGSTVYFAFRYEGNDVDPDNNFNGTYELDEISIDAQ